MPTNDNSWFDQDFYATQKVEQLKTHQDAAAQTWFAANNGGAADWTVELYNQYLGQYNIPGATTLAEKALANFNVCNQSGYTSAISEADVNVSPNQYFNVNEYLQDLVDYNIANPDAYDGEVPAGGWNLATMLDTMFNVHHTSAWAHYNANWETLRLNPSNAFDTNAYLQARADAMGNGADIDDAIAAIKELGINPLQDWYGFGQANNIAAPKVTSNPVTVELPNADWTVWGDGSAPEPPVNDDPFEQNVTNVDIKAGQTAYPGEGETYSGNTQFDATWIPSSAGSTLSAKDVITGPENTYNTLSVTLGKNWTGFNGVKQEDGTIAPSIENIGRIELIHNPANNEATYTFNAKNISDDTYRYDLVGADGPGAINLASLSYVPNMEIHISDLGPANVGKTNGKTGATDISFADGETKAKTDELTLVVENVGAEGDGAAPITSKNFGIETLTVETLKGDGQSYLDLSDLAGVKTLNFTGAGNIQVTEVAPGITTYDASGATGNVNMAVNSPRSSTVVKGGAGTDTVTVTTQTSWKPASLDDVEILAITNNATINLENVNAGLTDLYVTENGGTLKNLTADNFTVHLTALKAGEAVTVNGDKQGSLQNLTWDVPSTKSGQTVGTLETNAASTVTVAVAEGTTGATTVSSFKADSATALVVNAPANVTLGQADDSLKLVQDVTLNLENSATNGGHNTTQIKMDLPDAQNVTVNAEGQNVIFADLGDNKNDSEINLDVNGAHSFTVGDIQTTLGCSIDVNIEAESAVTIGNINNVTNLLAGGEGDLQVVVSTAGNIDGATSGTPVVFQTGPMTVNFSDVTGTAFAHSGLELSSQGTITYYGANGDDNVKITSVEADSTGSAINLGEGADKLEFATGLVTKGITTITVDLDEGTAKADEITINAQTGAHLIIDLENLAVKGTNDKITGLASSISVTAATNDTTPSTDQQDIAAMLKGFGIGDGSDSVALEVGSLTNAISGVGTFTYDGNVYSVDTAGVSSATVLVCLGSVDDIDVAGATLS